MIRVTKKSPGALVALLRLLVTHFVIVTRRTHVELVTHKVDAVLNERQRKVQYQLHVFSLSLLSFFFSFFFSSDVRELIQDFYASRYSSCLNYLSKIRPVLELDLHFHPHVSFVYEKIRSKALIQYFR